MSCWPSVRGVDDHAVSPGTEGKEVHDFCLTHSLDHEWNYFHLFERNLMGLFSSLLQYDAFGGGADGHNAEPSGAGGVRPLCVKCGKEKPFVIFENQVNVNVARPWMKAMLGDNFMLTKSTHVEICCHRTASIRGGDAWTHVPAFKKFMYDKGGIQLRDPSENSLQQISGVVSGKTRKRLCFLGRSKDTQEGGRGRAFRNQEELFVVAKAASFDPTFLTFEGKTPLEQVSMMATCDVAVGIHGAGLTNFMWMQPNSLAIQIAPYQSSTGFLQSYEAIAHAAGLRYKTWEPTSPNMVQVHWDQMKNDKHVLEEVCSCGVRNLMAHGTRGRCEGAADTDFLNWAFYINQDITVPADIFKGLLSGDIHESSVLDRGGDAAAATAHRGQTAEAAFNSLKAEKMAEARSAAETVLARLREMGVEEAESLCNEEKLAASEGRGHSQALALVSNQEGNLGLNLHS